LKGQQNASQRSLEYGFDGAEVLSVSFTGLHIFYTVAVYY
jgi:hypothetical protein